MTVRVLALIALVAVGCARDAGRAAREQYNAGVAALAAGELDDAEKNLLAARDDAGYDDELRFRAAFNLAAVAVARAEAAMAAQPPTPDTAMAAYERARTWLSDAVRRRPEDREARANLERVEARLLALVDEASKGDNALEARLERAIAAERSLRDAARGLWARQAVGGDPLADKDEFEAAATRQRTLGAEVGTIADLAGDEITAIGGKAEAERSDQEKVRLVQLQNLDLYVQDARKAMTDARRNLHELAGELAHGRTAAALESLKRAREQLQDPITVLQAVAGDEVELVRYLEVLAAKHDAPLPEWLTARGLGSQQIDLWARLEEVKARLRAALEAPSPTGDAAADPKAAEAAKVRAAVAAAMPAIEEASTQQKRASDALVASDVATGREAAMLAIAAMARAIEQFLALRQLIDVTLGEQRAVIAAITPPTAGAQALSAKERARVVADGVGKNRERLGRMTQMIADELATATAAASAPSDPQAGGAAPDPQALEQQRQLYARAEVLRAEADAALAALATVAAGGKGPPALDSATLAETKLVEMQKLFFSVIEHLKELIREQGETRDDTTTAQAEDDAGRATRLPGIVTRQSEHGQVADAIAQALAAQADAAGQNPGPATGGGPTPQALGQASTEVRNALAAMQDATTILTQARDQAQTMSVDINPALDDQAKALEHLENALRLLSPPPQQQQQDQQDPQQQQDQQQQQQQQQQQNSEQQLQQVREREAQRERERRERERQAAGNDPVDKDW